jgi:2-dehydro-3-deoxygluconokinase
LGTGAAWISCLPDNPLGHLVEAQLRLSGVDVSKVKWSKSGRLGLYFVEHGSEPRPTKVLYDRKGSSFAGLRPEEFDWGAVLAGTKVFHTTGITLALGPAPRRAVAGAAEAASKTGTMVSFDLNFRANLWSREQASEAYKAVLPSVDILFCSPGEIADLLGLGACPPREAMLRARERWGLRQVVLSVRAEGSISYATLGPGGELLRSREHSPDTVDRFGAGDAAAAAFLHCLVDGKGEAHAVELAAAASAAQHTVPGDVACFTLEELESIARGERGGLIR